MNIFIFKGRLTKDPELSYSANNTAVTAFTVAIDRRQGEADFIRCKAFNKTAETIGNYFSKGREILIQGHVNTGSYEKDGKRVNTTDFIVDRFEFCGSSKQAETAPAPAPKTAPEQMDLPSQFSAVDDDMPF